MDLFEYQSAAQPIIAMSLRNRDAVLWFVKDRADGDGDGDQKRGYVDVWGEITGRRDGADADELDNSGKVWVVANFDAQHSSPRWVLLTYIREVHPTLSLRQIISLYINIDAFKLQSPFRLISARNVCTLKSLLFISKKLILWQSVCEVQAHSTQGAH